MAAIGGPPGGELIQQPMNEVDAANVLLDIALGQNHEGNVFNVDAEGDVIMNVMNDDEDDRDTVMTHPDYEECPEEWSWDPEAP